MTVVYWMAVLRGEYDPLRVVADTFGIDGQEAIAFYQRLDPDEKISMTSH